MSPTPQIIAARYRVLRELGRGGMGVVHLVEHVHTGEQFAMKVLLAHSGASADLIERFKRESRAPARIKSDHVVKVIDADVAAELDGAPFLVMELLDGTNLEDYINQSGPLSVEETIGILRQLAVALDKAHAIGIVHRDLKPENVFLHRREQHRVVKLLDFGISKLTDEGGGDIASASLTRTGMMMGTPLYMSPEQARGETKITPATDIWAIGLIAFRMLSKATYWDAQTIAVLMSQILALPMPPASSRAPLAPSFDGWFACACHRDPSRRFRTVGEQIEALATAYADPRSRGTMQGTSPPVTPRMPQPFRSTTPLPQVGAAPGSAPPPSRVAEIAPLPIVSTNAAMGMAHTKLGASGAIPVATRGPKLVAAAVAVLGLLLVVGFVARQTLHKNQTTPSGNVAVAGLTGPMPAPAETTAAPADVATAPPKTEPLAVPPPSPLPKTKIITGRDARGEADAGQRADTKLDTTPEPAAPVTKPVRPAVPAGTYAPTAL